MPPDPDELGADPRAAYLRYLNLRNQCIPPRPTAEECLAHSLDVHRRARCALDWNRLLRAFLHHETAR